MHQRRTSKGSWWPVVVVAVLMTAVQEHVCMRSCDDPPSTLHIASTSTCIPPGGTFAVMWLGHCLWINDCLFVEFHRNINCFISWTLNHVDLNFQVIICSCKIYVESVLFVTKQPFDAECGQLDAGKRFKIERFIESAKSFTSQSNLLFMKWNLTANEVRGFNPLKYALCTHVGC